MHPSAVPKEDTALLCYSLVQVLVVVPCVEANESQANHTKRMGASTVLIPSSIKLEVSLLQATFSRKSMKSLALYTFLSTATYNSMTCSSALVSNNCMGLNPCTLLCKYAARHMMNLLDKVSASRQDLNSECPSIT
eukprot:5903402-Amphidinium_carterae.1